ncbi:MAG: hypothetical protein LAT63_10015 [Marinobacter sp.]|nr:hypothetical protein [Marinobacter sp.]
MQNVIAEWIRQVNITHAPLRQSCVTFQDAFDGFYSPDFLASAYFVVVDRIPKPDFPELRAAGFGAFMDMEAAGITYDDTYYVQRRFVGDRGLHFHELVHVLQWSYLQREGFITRYMSEILSHGYQDAPLEVMAYQLDGHYRQGNPPFDVQAYVQQNL